MAIRRMISKNVTDDDSFTKLSSPAQALYMHLVLSSDDYGFCKQIQLCMFKAHAKSENYEELKTSGYIIEFPDGVIVITHWLQQNQIQPSKRTKTVFTDDLKQLQTDDNKMYFLPDKIRTESGQNPGQCSLVKDRLVKDRKPLSGNPDGDDPVSFDKPKKKRKSYSSEVQQIIDYLNHETEKDFKNVPATEKMIQSLLRTGYSVEDIKNVIYKKSRQWLKDPVRNKYLRPKTLFDPSNFEGYLNEKEISPNIKNNISITLPEYLNKPQEQHKANPDTIEEIKRMQEQMKTGNK